MPMANGNSLEELSRRKHNIASLGGQYPMRWQPLSRACPPQGWGVIYAIANSSAPCRPEPANS